MSQKTNHILLLGAGFSRNWGGWLATEVFEYLLGHRVIKEDSELKKLLWENKTKGFEEVLYLIRKEANSASAKIKLINIESAILDMFEDMNKIFSADNSIFKPPVHSCLSRFDAIFTLNQDLLLEKQYQCKSAFSKKPYSWDATLQPSSKWTDWQLPGMVKVEENFLVPGTKINFQESLSKGKLQPIYKLHGSCNWRVVDGNNILIMGGEKSAQIDSFEILRWYREQFIKCISKADTRLMIIGYGFGDQHINEALIQGAQSGELGIFIVDPLGVDAVGQHNPTRNRPQYMPTPLEEALNPIIMGASRRSLYSTLGEDLIEYNKMVKFFY